MKVLDCDKWGLMVGFISYYFSIPEFMGNDWLVLFQWLGINDIPLRLYILFIYINIYAKVCLICVPINVLLVIFSHDFSLAQCLRRSAYSGRPKRRGGDKNPTVS